MARPSDFDGTTLVLEWDGNLDTSPFVFVDTSGDEESPQVSLTPEQWRRLDAPTALTVVIWTGDRVSGADRRNGVARCDDCFAFPRPGA